MGDDCFIKEFRGKNMDSKDMCRRTFYFAVAVGNLIEQLPSTVSNRAYFAQIIRSSASVGANYRASRRAKSEKDFINKLKIVEEETDETVYFLELLLALNKNYSAKIEPLIKEGESILRIIVATLKTIRAKLKNNII
jgi:four helix bundle protein